MVAKQRNDQWVDKGPAKPNSGKDIMEPAPYGRQTFGAAKKPILKH